MTAVAVDSQSVLFIYFVKKTFCPEKKKKKRYHGPIWMCQITQIMEEEALSGLTSVMRKQNIAFTQLFLSA